MAFGGEDSNLTNTLPEERVSPYTIAQKQFTKLLLYVQEAQ